MTSHFEFDEIMEFSTPPPLLETLM